MSNAMSLLPTSQLIETMRLNKHGQIMLLALHLRRLQRSAQTLGFAYCQRTLLQAMRPYLHQSYCTPQRLRLLLHRTGEFEIVCTPLLYTPGPVKLILQPDPIRAPLAALYHKTTQRTHWTAGEAWLQRHPSFFDVIYNDDTGLITEGGRSNIYLLRDNQWVTPAISSPMLAGVQRQYLLNKGWATEGTISRDELLSASRLRISNALRGWLDATLVTKHV